MGLETATYVDELVATNPVGTTDPKSQGDDHLRLIKSVLKTTFPGLAGGAFRIQTKTTDYTLIGTDNMSVLLFTGSATLSLTAAATLGNKLMAVIISKAASVTIDPNGAETVNGAATQTLSYNEAGLLFCDGTSDFPFMMLGGVGGGASTGDVKASMKATAEPGWILTGGTIGDATSGGTRRAAADCEALFTLIYNGMSNTEAPVSGGRGANAAADWAAHKTIAVPDIGGRVVIGKESAASRITAGVCGIDGATLGAAGGNQSMQQHIHATVVGNSIIGFGTDTDTGHGAAFNPTGNTSPTGNGSSENVQPSIVLNYFVKL